MTRKIFIIAGEASGDMLGAALMRDLKILSPEADVFNGIGGKEMINEGLVSIFPMTDLSVMGLTEVVKHLPRLLKRLKQTHEAILDFNPDVLITVDSPDFCLRVAKKIKKAKPGLKIIHYVAPTVWAWRPGRAKKIAKFLDGLLCLFPFEPPYFTKYDLQAQFVGHPLGKIIQRVTEEQKKHFFDNLKLNANKPLLCLLPGSRMREIESLLPVFMETVSRLRRTIPDLQIIVPCLDHTKERVVQLAGAEPMTIFVPKGNQDKYTAFAASTAALHASGTVALELALCGTPMVTAYKVGAVSAWIGKRLLTTPFVNLVNIILGRPIVPEMLQEHCNPDALTATVQALLTQEPIRQLQQEQLHEVQQHLKEPKQQHAAQFISHFL